MSLVRSCYASLNCSALCKPSASFISSCITLGLLKTAHPPKTRATSANGFMCWINRLLLNPIEYMIMLLMFIQFAALLNRELGAGVLVVSSLSIAKNPVTFTIWTPACAAYSRPSLGTFVEYLCDVKFGRTWLSDFGTAPHPSDISSPASAILGSHQSAPPSASPVHHPLLAPQGSTDDPVATPAAAI